MDEWVEDGKVVSTEHPLSFAKADMQLCFDKIKPELRMPESNIHFPTAAATVGPVETWKSARVSIWHPGHHDNPFGIRLTALMISKKIPDPSVPMSLLADHPDVTFNYYRHGVGTVQAEMH